MVASPPQEELKGAGDTGAGGGAAFDTSIDEVPKCPLTKWNSQGIDIQQLQAPERTIPLTVRYDPASGLSESESIAQQREEILAQLEVGGAIWFRGFELMKTKDGFQEFYEQLQLNPCQDPLASVGGAIWFRGFELMKTKEPDR